MCWAHARRKFYDAKDLEPDFAERALGLIKELYAVERQAADMEHQERKKLRQEKSAPVLESIKALLENPGKIILPKNKMAEAINYTLSHWKQLTAYLEDGRLPIDNNLVENTIRHARNRGHPRSACSWPHVLAGPGKRWTRKLAEMIITLEIEQRFPRNRFSRITPTRSIWARAASFRIHGFGEASEAYLGKDLGQITLPEAAELAGMIRTAGGLRPLSSSGPAARAAQPGAVADAAERLHHGPRLRAGRRSRR